MNVSQVETKLCSVPQLANNKLFTRSKMRGTSFFFSLISSLLEAKDKFVSWYRFSRTTLTDDKITKIASGSLCSLYAWSQIWCNDDPWLYHQANCILPKCNQFKSKLAHFKHKLGSRVDLMTINHKKTNLNRFIFAPNKMMLKEILWKSKYS